MNQPSSEPVSWGKRIKRFLGGSIVGLFLALIYWSYSAYFHVSFSLAHGIFSSLILILACGAIAAFISFEKLMDNFPPL